MSALTVSGNQGRPHANRFAMKRKVIYQVICGALALLACACSSQRAVAPATPDTGGNDIPAAASTSQQVFQTMTAGAKEWKNVSVPAKINLEAPAKLSVSARVVMVRDKSIDVSVRMLGFEVGYIVADCDSVHGYVKVNKKYVSESLAQFFGADGYTLSNVQDMLLGRIFYPGMTALTAADTRLFDFDDIDRAMVITPKRQPSGAEFGFVVDRDTRRLFTTALKAGQHEAVVNYFDIAATPAGEMAGVTTVTVDNGKMAATVDWDLSGAKWNASNVKPREWSTPRGATRIRLNAQLLKNLLGGR